jgi:gliding motility-associated lipoprotein GldH
MLLKNNFFPLLMVCLACWSCDPKGYFSEYQSLPESGWANSFQPEFLVDIEDTAQVFNMQVMFRHAPDYPFQNLYVLLHTSFPNQKHITDTLTLFLFDAKGKPLGSCMGDLCDVQFMYRKGVKFPEKGRYSFKIEQRMRTTNGILPLIFDAGLRLEKTSFHEK